MIDPKAEPIDNRPPYQPIEVSGRKPVRLVCPFCGTDNPADWETHKSGCQSPLALPF